MGDVKGADGDKTSTGASYSAFHIRGRRVVAEVSVPRELVQQVLHTTPESIVRVHRAFQSGRRLGGDLHDNVQCSNGIAAMFIAMGQDAACAIESSAGILHLDIDGATNGLYASIMMPNIHVGTIGGGTHLPGGSACLELLFQGRDYSKDGSAGELAEVICATCLGGEISCLAAIATGDFSKAHRELRERPS